jgi:Flp pilus assembly protein TadD
MVVGAGVFWDSLFELLKNKIVHIVVALAMVVLLYLPVSWSIKNHPNEVVYFNELEGGIDNAYGNYETDYYMNSIKQACAWFEKNVPVSKPIIVGTNCNIPVGHYLTAYSKNITVSYVRFDDRDKKDWDYAIFYSRFIDPDQVGNNSWISKNVLHIVKADDAALCIIVKRTDKSDLYASQAMKKNDYQTAISYYKQAIKADSNNDLAYNGLTIAYLQSAKLDSALAVAQNTLKVFPGYESALMIIGVIKLQQGDAAQAAQTFASLIGKDSTNTNAYFYLAKCHMAQGYAQFAINDLTTDIRINPDDINGYYGLGGLYKQQGNNEMANQCFEIVNELKKQMHH